MPYKDLQKKREYNKQWMRNKLVSGKVWKGENLMDWAKKNFNIVEPRLRTKCQGWKYVGKHMANARAKKTNIWKFKVEY